MTSEYKKKIISLIEGYFKDYKTECTDSFINAWVSVLKSYSINELRVAFTRARITKPKFMKGADEIAGYAQEIRTNYWHATKRKERDAPKRLERQYKGMTPELKRKCIITFFEARNKRRAKKGTEPLAITEHRISQYVDKDLWELI